MRKVGRDQTDRKYNVDETGRSTQKDVRKENVSICNISISNKKKEVWDSVQHFVPSDYSVKNKLKYIYNFHFWVYWQLLY